MKRVCLLAAFLSVVAVRPSDAQSCTTLPAAPLTESVSLDIVLLARDKSGQPRASYDDMQAVALREILSHLLSVLPSLPSPRPADLRTRFAQYDSTAGLYAPDLAAAFTFRLDANGRIDDVEVNEASIDASTDSLLAVGIARASGAPALAGLAGVFGANSVRLELFTTLRRDRRPGAVNGVQAQFAKLSLPLYVGSPVEIILPAMGPRYPDEKLRNAEFGDVLANFIVAADSSVERRSIRIVRASDTEFGNAIRSWLPTLRYRPVHLSGCPVRSRVQQPNRFSPRPPGR